jgi:hypothetical protein
MDDITLNLISLAAFALIGGLVFLFVRQKQAAREQALIALATEKGWKYEPVREPRSSGFRLSSPAWILESIATSSGQESGPGSSDVAASTRWTSEIAGEALLIGERTSTANLGNFGEMLTNQVLQLALGAEAAGLQEVKAGSETFQKRYMVWCKNPETVRISPALENALLNWQGQKPLIKHISGQLEIEIRGKKLTRREEILAVTHLAQAIMPIIETN